MIRTAMILAAGRGTKIWPYGDTWPKAALPVANRAVIRRQIDALQACGMETIIVVVGYLSAQVKTAVADIAEIHFVEQGKPTGTADALLLGLSRCKEEREFLVVYGDILFAEEDCKALLDSFHAGNGSAALVQPLGRLSSQEWLCAEIRDGCVQQILGHPREAGYRLCGLYALTMDIIGDLETNPGIMTSVEVGAMPPPESELAESLNRYIRKGNRIQAVEAQQFFVDIDKPWHLLDANTDLLHTLGAKLTADCISPSASVAAETIDGHIVVGDGSVIGNDVKIKGNLWVGKNSRIVDGVILGTNTIIGDDCLVREYCRIEDGSAIGNRCVVGHAAEFGGILMDGAYSYHYGEYWGVIGRSSDLGAATVCGNLRFDDQTTIHTIKGRREQPPSPGANAAFLGDFTRTGVNTILMPGVKVGAYSVIGAGVILNEDVPNHSLIYVKQELIRKSWGPEKYGW
ncbi:MAG: nucleotidyl transferase [Candidatus Omnitrophota bacterium]|jgi:bifunctional UDP-N-acetylglucosamine pyrophosphorylase/glucosamine-1-phosphate N-acetyltransferase|nr:MAG: nucleotidyl transferase [Candidatus Omnitrophota bacterium]